MDGCNGKNSLVMLRDRYGKEFPVKCCCEFCYNVIYNSLPLGRSERSGDSEKAETLGSSPCLSMDAAETERIAEQFLQAYRYGSVQEPGQEYTKGHFRRKVE